MTLASASGPEHTLHLDVGTVEGPMQESISRASTAPMPAVPPPAARMARDDREVWMERPTSTRWRRVAGAASSTSAR